MDPYIKLSQLDSALGRLAPKGTWLNEILENIWRADNQFEANRIAEEARKMFGRLGIEEALWVGDRCESDDDGQNA